MAAGAGRGPKASAVKQASIEDANTFLQSLPEKPKEDLSLKEAIDQMRESVQSALAKGYTYQELAAMLTEKGIKISAFTLKNYVPSGRRRAAKEQSAKSTGRKARKTKDADPDFAAASVEAEVAPAETDAETNAEVSVAQVAEAVEALAADDALQATTKGGRGRGKSTAAKTAAAAESTVKQGTSKRPRSTTSTTKQSGTKGSKKNQ